MYTCSLVLVRERLRKYGGRWAPYSLKLASIIDSMIKLIQAMYDSNLSSTALVADGVSARTVM